MKKLTNIYLYDHATCKRMLGNVFNEEKHVSKLKDEINLKIITIFYNCIVLWDGLK